MLMLGERVQLSTACGGICKRLVDHSPNRLFGGLFGPKIVENCVGRI
jgi:hypothetical protein